MEETLYYNAVNVRTGGSYKKLAKLKQKYGSWRVAYEKIFHTTSSGVAERYGEELSKNKVSLALLENTGYPALLRHISDPPFGLYSKGVLPEKDPITLSIVGTRRATPSGKTAAEYFARELSAGGFAIVSGLAFGIDAAAHSGCLESKGVTIAVLAGGLDEVYPQEHAHLAQKILEANGAIVSEYPLHSPAYPVRFLERNRIVSGLSRGILVVEAPKNSGSLATARYAFEQNREVFVVPGPISHLNFFGSHQLIRQGAELVTDPEEIFRAYGVSSRGARANKENSATREERLIIEALREISRPVGVDKIIGMTKLEPRIVNRSLAFLIIEGLVKEKSGGYTI